MFTMASKFLCTLSFLILLASSVKSLSSPLNSSAKVSLELYYESMCPGCVHFITNLLPQIFTNGIISIVDLHFSPWGNAKLLSNETIVCQHGEKECFFNLLEACAIDVWPDLDTHFHFIHCIESIDFAGKFYPVLDCFDTLGLPMTPIGKCFVSGRGPKLLIGYGKETAALKPPHEYVPWVVVNGNPLYDDYERFINYICDAYKGSPKPTACNDFPPVGYFPALSVKESFRRTDKVYSERDDTSVRAGKFARSKMIHP